MTDRERLLALLDVFESALADFTALVRDLRDDEWELPTDLPGWTVHDLVSHTAHLEAVIAGSPEETVEVPQGLTHVTSLMGFYTEQGVIARKERTRDGLAELADAAGRRLRATRADPPADGAGSPPKTPGDIGWRGGRCCPTARSTSGCTSRTSGGRPAGPVTSTRSQRGTWSMSSRAGSATSGARRWAPSPGRRPRSSCTYTGHRFAVTVGDDGRGTAAPQDTRVDTTLRMDTGTFVVLCGGRRPPDTRRVDVGGDPGWGAAPLQALDDTVGTSRSGLVLRRVRTGAGSLGETPHMRALPVAIALVTLAVAGCDGDTGGSDSRASVPTAQPPVTSAASPRSPTCSGPDGNAASAVREDSVYPAVGDPRVDALHYDLDLRWEPEHDASSGAAVDQLPRRPATGARFSSTSDLPASPSTSQPSTTRTVPFRHPRQGPGGPRRSGGEGPALHARLDVRRPPAPAPPRRAPRRTPPASAGPPSPTARCGRCRSPTARSPGTRSTTSRPTRRSTT